MLICMAVLVAAISATERSAYWLSGKNHPGETPRPPVSRLRRYGHLLPLPEKGAVPVASSFLPLREKVPCLAGWMRGQPALTAEGA